MSDQPAPIDPNIDPYGYLLFKLQPDGSVNRLPKFPETPASSDLSTSNSYHLSKDILINHQLSVRVFVPRQAFDDDSTSTPDSKKFPLIIYFHGGGFVICSAASSIFNDFYNSIAAGIPAVIVSVDYRLAPEHRLPAAYDDCFEALQWISKSDDEWITKYADISNCFLMGSSAGANISYMVGLRAAANVEDLKPLEIKGLIHHIPFLGGNKRTESELKLANDMVLPLCATDIMWDLCLPVGADRDHEFCNLVSAAMNPQVFDNIKGLGWKILVAGYYGDPLIDRQIELVKKMEENNVKVEGKFFEGGFHGCDMSDATLLQIISNVVKHFVESSITSEK